MTEIRPDVRFEYSFSDGQYWSSYDHCRVWENGTYNLKIRDNFGNIAEKTYEETGVIKDERIPVQISFTDFIDYNGNTVDYYDGIVMVRKNEKMIVTIPAGFSSPALYIKEKGQTAWRKLGDFSGETYTVTNPGQAEYYVADTYDRYSKTFTSEVVTVTVYAPQPSITVVHADSESIITKVTDSTPVASNAAPLKYALSYDGGVSYSDWQFGNWFKKFDPSAGTYVLKAKIKYTTGREGVSTETTVVIK